MYNFISLRNTRVTLSPSKLKNFYSVSYKTNFFTWKSPWNKSIMQKYLVTLENNNFLWIL